jgi:UDP-glucose 4-epimerase
LKILVTGATGFIGSALCLRLTSSLQSGLQSGLQSRGHQVVGLVRSNSELSFPKLSFLKIEINDLTQISPDHLEGVDVVVHTAGMAHQVNVDPVYYQNVNVDGSVNLANACVKAGVSRMISLSSIKAVGEGSVGPQVKAAPKTPYGISKYQAELKLAEIQSNSSIDIIQLRIPLTFGSNAKGNFQQLINLTKKPWPLPLSALSAKRHYLYIENLLDFVVHCFTAKIDSNKPLFLADEAPVRFGELLRALSIAQGRRPFDIPFPNGLLTRSCKRILPAKRYQQIFHDSFVDSTETFQSCNWKPKYSTIEGIYQMFGKSI